MRALSRFMILGSALWLGACATLTRAPEPLPLQLQAFQKREFEVDQAVAMRSVMSVFQDLGYIIQSADKDVGFITATSPARTKTGFLDVLAAAVDAYSPETVQTRATAVIEELRPSFTTVRLNFVINTRTSTDKGASSATDEPVEDPEPYRVAFDKIEDAIFLRVGTRGAPPAAAAATADSPQPPAMNGN